jgi:hypothetical protein
MTKKSLLLGLVLAASSGFVRAADSPIEVLIATALQPPTAINLTALPASAPLDLQLEQPVFAAQTNFAIVRPIGGFKPSGDIGKAFFDLNLVAMIGLNIADYVSTREALKYPGLHESNPLMQPFIKNPAVFAAVKIGTTALTFWSMKALFKKNKTVAWVLTAASNVLMSYVVANNLQRIHQARAQ